MAAVSGSKNGNMYLSGQILLTKNTGISASNAGYFTINTVTQSGGTATTPHLYLSNASPVGSILHTVRLC